MAACFVHTADRLRVRRPREAEEAGALHTADRQGNAAYNLDRNRGNRTLEDLVRRTVARTERRPSNLASKALRSCWTIRSRRLTATAPCPRQRPRALKRR